MPLCSQHTRVQIAIVTLIAVPLPPHSACMPSTQCTLNLICRWILLIPTNCTLPVPLTSRAWRVRRLNTTRAGGLWSVEKRRKLWVRERCCHSTDFSSHVMSTFTSDVHGSIFICIGGVMLCWMCNSMPRNVALLMRLHGVWKFIRAPAERSLSIWNHNPSLQF